MVPPEVEDALDYMVDPLFSARDSDTVDAAPYGQGDWIMSWDMLEDAVDGLLGMRDSLKVANLLEAIRRIDTAADLLEPGDELDVSYIAVIQHIRRAMARQRWTFVRAVTKMLSVHKRAVISANHPTRKRSRGEFEAIEC